VALNTITLTPEPIKKTFSSTLFIQIWLINIKSVRSICYDFVCPKSNVFNQQILPSILASSQLTIRAFIDSAIVLLMFMLSFICCGLVLFEWKWIYVDFQLFVYIHVLRLEIQLSRGEGWDPINWFNATTVFVPVSSQDMAFQPHMSWSVCVQWEVIVYFVDIDGIVDHHRLKILYINPD